MYNLEIEKAIKTIKKQRVKTVCIQLPDGLKPKANEIADRIERETNAKVVVWAGSCFGSCDVPDLKNIDLLIQWGHSGLK